MDDRACEILGQMSKKYYKNLVGKWMIGADSSEMA